MNFVTISEFVQYQLIHRTIQTNTKEVKPILNLGKVFWMPFLAL